METQNKTQQKLQKAQTVFNTSTSSLASSRLQPPPPRTSFFTATSKWNSTLLPTPSHHLEKDFAARRPTSSHSMKCLHIGNTSLRISIITFTNVLLFDVCVNYSKIQSHHHPLACTRCIHIQTTRRSTV